MEILVAVIAVPALALIWRSWRRASRMLSAAHVTELAGALPGLEADALDVAGPEPTGPAPAAVRTKEGLVIAYTITRGAGHHHHLSASRDGRPLVHAECAFLAALLLERYAVTVPVSLGRSAEGRLHVHFVLDAEAQRAFAARAVPRLDDREVSDAITRYVLAGNGLRIPPLARR